MIFSFAKSVITSGITAASEAVKGGEFNPIEVAKKAANSLKINYPVTERYSNGVAMTPPMGWSSWNLFRNKIDENLIYETAKAMKESGLSECGYQYINIDDCWQSSFRDEQGRLQADFGTFPNGIKNLAQRVNELGLKLGIYSSNGTLTCEDLPASLGNEAIDADTFAEWGVEYFKYDFCHNIPIPSLAPKLDRIIISDIENENIISLCVDQAHLSGSAKLVADEKMTAGIYLTGLSSNAGACEFRDIEIKNAGDYIVTLCFRKENSGDKYCELLVNGKDKYSAYLPATKNFTREGRYQVKIKLEEGLNSLKIYNPVSSVFDSTVIQYTNMGKELKRATREYAIKNGTEEKPIVYSICEWGYNRPFIWGKQAGNLWRITPDIMPNWTSVVGIYEIAVLLYKHAAPGGWNDPDMLEVGNGTLSYEENKSHFTLWCMLAAPLMLGNDIRDFVNPDGSVDKDHPTYQIVSNRDVIAIDQDPLGMQCRRVSTNGAEDVLVKPLAGDEFAICFFNKSKNPTIMSYQISKVVGETFVTTEFSENYLVNDLWEKNEFTVKDTLAADVPGHGVRIFRVKKV